MPTSRSPALLSSRDVGGRNRATVLRALADHGPLSRAELAAAASVTRATIGAIVQPLLDDGIIEERPAPARRGVGKPARPLWFAPGSGRAASVEVTATAVRGAVVDARAEVGPVEAVALADPADPEEVVAAAATVAARLAAPARGTGGAPAALLGIGVVVPGTCDGDTGTVVGSGQVPGATGRGLLDRLAADLGLPVYLENDSRAQALAEHWFGAGRGVATFASVQTGAGLGAGLVLDGTLHHGPGGRAGELGHAPVAGGGARCRCGLRGCWETTATTRWLRAEATAAGLPGAGAMGARELVALAAAGSAPATALLDRYAANLAVGLAVLVQVLHPERIILQGDAVAGGAAVRDRVQAELDRRSLAPVPVVLGRLADPALLGGGARVLAGELHRSAPAARPRPRAVAS